MRLVGGVSRCAGRVELHHQGEWRRLINHNEYSTQPWVLKDAAVLCRQLDCGSAISTREDTGDEDYPVWRFKAKCVGSESALRQCGSVVQDDTEKVFHEVICSGNKIIISLLSAVDQTVMHSYHVTCENLDNLFFGVVLCCSVKEIVISR